MPFNTLLRSNPLGNNGLPLFLMHGNRNPKLALRRGARCAEQTELFVRHYAHRNRGEELRMAALAVEGGEEFASQKRLERRLKVRKTGGGIGL